MASKEAINEEKDAAYSSKEVLIGNEIIRDVDMVDDANQPTNQCKVRLERLSAAEIENKKCETEQDHVGVNNCENMSNKDTEKQMALEKQKLVCESPSNLVPGVQIAKIKERLFEKIKVPASSTPKAQSPRRARSPLRGGNCTPRKENSPNSKGKVIEKVIVSDQIENSEDAFVDEKKLEVFISTDCDSIKEVESSEKKDSNGEELDNDSDGCFERKGPKIVKVWKQIGHWIIQKDMHPILSLTSCLVLLIYTTFSSSGLSYVCFRTSHTSEAVFIREHGILVIKYP